MKQSEMIRQYLCQGGRGFAAQISRDMAATGMYPGVDRADVSRHLKTFRDAGEVIVKQIEVELPCSAHGDTRVAIVDCFEKAPSMRTVLQVRIAARRNIEPNLPVWQRAIERQSPLERAWSFKRA